MKTLIAYSTKTNATRDNAQWISETLEEKGHTVEMVDLKKEKVKDLAPYDLILIGSGIRIGMWYGPTKSFLKRKDLADRRYVLFISCMTAAPSVDDDDAERFITKIVEKRGLKPFDTGIFIGMYPGKPDERDPELVKQWARELAEKVA